MYTKLLEGSVKHLSSMDETDEVDRVHSMLRWILRKICLASQIAQHANLARSKLFLHTARIRYTTNTFTVFQITGLLFSTSKRETERISVSINLLIVVSKAPQVVE
jgi:hypothetical protein